MPPEKQALRRAADAVGGQAALAKLLKLKRRQNVWPWFQEGRDVPAEYCPAIEAATCEAALLKGRPELVVRCEELRPDVAWEVLRAPRAAEHTAAQEAA